MSDKGSKKNGIASLRRAVKPEVDCKVFFVGKWNAGTEVSDELLRTVSASIAPSGGIKTKLRMFSNGLKVGEKSSIFSAFPEQFYPIASVRSLKRDETQTNTVVIITQNAAQMWEVSVYRCPTEYEASKFVECFDKYKVEKAELMDTKQRTVENWSYQSKNTSKKYPRAVIATSVNGINGHAENGTKVTTDTATKTMHIQQAEPIYATVNKTKGPVGNQDLAARVQALELENQYLREYINQHLVTTYQAQRVKQTEVPIESMLLLEGNRLRPLSDDHSTYMSVRSDNGSLNNSGQFERGSLQYQRRAESVNGYGPTQKEIQTRFLVPATTLRQNMRHHTYVPRKIQDVYKTAKRQQPVQVQQMQPEYQDVAESLPPRDSISSLSNSDIEDNGDAFEITTPTPVRYM